MEWIKIQDANPMPYTQLLYLLEDGNIISGFLNAFNEYMVGAQGRFAHKHTDVENQITHIQLAPKPPKPKV